MHGTRRALAALAVLSIGGLALGQAPASAEVPRLELSAREWDFGTVWQGQPVEGRVTIRNVGTAPLRIEDVKTSCGCTVPSKPKSELAPGESDLLTIGYTTATKVGVARQSISLMTNDPVEPAVSVAVRGEVKPLFEEKPTGGLMFGRLLQSSSETRRMEIVSNYDEPVELALVEGQAFDPFDVRLETLEPGRRYRVTAKIEPPVRSGVNQTLVRVKTGLDFYPQLVLTAYGFVAPPISVDRKFISLPKNSVLEMKQRLWVQRNPDRDDLEVTSVRATHPEIAVEFRKIDREKMPAARGDFEVLVTLPPGDRIEAGAEPKIEILTNAQEPDLRVLEVPVRIVAPPAPRAAQDRPGEMTGGDYTLIPGRVERN